MERRAGKFVEQAVYQARASGLVTRSEGDLLCAMAFFADANGGAIYASPATLAKRIQCSERQAQRIQASLRGRGILLRDAMGGRGPSSRSCYRIHLLALAPHSEATPAGNEKRVTSPAAKGDTSGAPRVTIPPAKGDILSPKGDTQMSPELSTSTKSNKPEQQQGGTPPAAALPSHSIEDEALEWSKDSSRDYRRFLQELGRRLELTPAHASCGSDYDALVRAIALQLGVPLPYALYFAHVDSEPVPAPPPLAAYGAHRSPELSAEGSEGVAQPTVELQQEYGAAEVVSSAGGL